MWAQRYDVEAIKLETPSHLSCLFVPVPVNRVQRDTPQLRALSLSLPEIPPTSSNNPDPPVPLSPLVFCGNAARSQLSKIPSCLVVLMDACFEVDPSRRPTLDQFMSVLQMCGPLSLGNNAYTQCLPIEHIHSATRQCDDYLACRLPRLELERLLFEQMEVATPSL